VAAGRVTVEGREIELREEVNAALKKMRAYARDMEVHICRTYHEHDLLLYVQKKLLPGMLLS